MPSQPPLPATLSRYLRPGPPGSLSLVTSVLDATGNWLFLRLLYAVLTAKLDDAEGDNTCCVVFVDFLQCFDFWRGEAKRAVGLDLTALSDQARFCYVDGLTSLFSKQTGPRNTSERQPAEISALSSTFQASSRPSLAGAATRAPLAVSSRNPQIAASGTEIRSQPSPGSSSHTTDQVTHTLHYTTLPSLLSTLQSIISCPSLSLPRTILFLNFPDILLSTMPSLTPTILASNLLLPLRSLPQVHSTMVSLHADSPLVFPAPTSMSTLLPFGLTPSHAGLVTSLSHVAERVFQVRALDSGRAKDIGGVLRISRGGGWDGGRDGDEDEAEGDEWLWKVAGDGGVGVWGRGE